MMPYKTFLDNNSRNGRWEYLEYDMNYKTDRFYKMITVFTPTIIELI